MVCCLAITFAVTAADSDWSQFRGPRGLSATDDTGLPVTWGGDGRTNVRWKTPLPTSNNPFSSPIVAGGRVFVTSAINKPIEHRVLCFNADDGKLLWDTHIDPGPWRLTDLRGGYNAPTPASDSEHVFALFGSAVLVSLDFQGKLAWRKELPSYNFDVAIGCSPVLYKETVLQIADQNGGKSSLIAFDKKTGEIKWDQPRPNQQFAHGTPVVIDVAGKMQLLISGSSQLQGVDPETGQVIWFCQSKGESASPAYGAGLVYTDTGRGGGGICVDPTGQGDVTSTHLKWKAANGKIGEGLGSPIIVGDLLYRLHKGTTLSCFNVATGEVQFEEKLAGANSWTSPFSTTDGRIYIASAGRSYVLKAGRKLEVLATNELNDPNPAASPAVSAGRIYLRGTKFLWCMEIPK